MISSDSEDSDPHSTLFKKRKVKAVNQDSDYEEKPEVKPPKGKKILKTNLKCRGSQNTSTGKINSKLVEHDLEKRSNGAVETKKTVLKATIRSKSKTVVRSSDAEDAEDWACKKQASTGVQKTSVILKADSLSPVINNKSNLKTKEKVKELRSKRKTSPKGESNNEGTESCNADKKLCNWNPADVISAELQLPWAAVSATCALLEAGQTVPFLARYRREVTGGLGPDALRQLEERRAGLRAVQEKASRAVAAADRAGHLTPDLQSALLACRSLPELELLQAPFKAGARTSLAGRAREAGLEPVAEQLLAGVGPATLAGLIQTATPGRDTLLAVETSVGHILADIIIHHTETVEFIRSLQTNCRLVLESKVRKGKPWEKEKVDKGNRGVDPNKFENYFEFSCPVQHVRPHQTLAINRGEAQKVLSVKVVVPDAVLNQLEDRAGQRWRGGRKPLVRAALTEGYKRLVVPLVSRQARARLTRAAEQESLAVFRSNLRSLLLAPPLRHSPVLALDPGFKHGCKVAVLGPTGSLLDSAVLRLTTNNTAESPAGRQLTSLLTKYATPTVAIGNGTACRETETLVAAVIEKGGVPAGSRYTIVSEQGASIYSCSPAAAAEFPGLDTNIVSAISIGRRLQDPLSELVKIEPQHLGVGQYQHDLPPARLRAALEDCVVECVSFVGVDLNCCSEPLLARVAGLSTNKARAILAVREARGGFSSRTELREVAGVGPKVWQQCIGFLRLAGATDNPLDQTEIHPESYSAAEQLVELAGVELKQLGKPEFRTAVEKLADKDEAGLAARLGVGIPTLHSLLEALQQRPGWDCRQDQAKPLFRRGLTKLEDCKPGHILTGRVTNCTNFGAFCDVGLGLDGLVHSSKMRGHKLELGTKLEVRVISIEIARKRIGLEVVKIL